MVKQLPRIHCPTCGWWWVTQGSICASCASKLNNKKRNKIMSNEIKPEWAESILSRVTKRLGGSYSPVTRYHAMMEIKTSIEQLLDSLEQRELDYKEFTGEKS